MALIEADNLVYVNVGTPAAVAVLLEAVWICALGADLGAQPNETLVLLDSEGKRAAGSTASCRTSGSGWARRSCRSRRSWASGC